MTSSSSNFVTRKLKLINFLSVQAIVFAQFTTVDDWDVAFDDNLATTSLQKIASTLTLSGIHSNNSTVVQKPRVTPNLRTATYSFYSCAPGTSISLSVKVDRRVAHISRIGAIPMSLTGNVFPSVDDVTVINSVAKGISVAAVRFPPSVDGVIPPSGISALQFAADFSKGLSNSVDLSFSVLPTLVLRTTSTLLNTNPSSVPSVQIQNPYDSSAFTGALDTNTYGFPVVLSDQYVSPNTVNNSDAIGVPFSHRVLLAADKNEVVGYNSKTPLHYHTSLKRASGIVRNALANASPVSAVEENSLLWWIRNLGVLGLGWKFDDFYSNHPFTGYVWTGQGAPPQALNPPSLVNILGADADTYHFLTQPQEEQELARAYGSGRVTVWQNGFAGAPGFATDTADPSETWWPGNNGFTWLPSTDAVANVTVMGEGQNADVLSITFRNVSWLSGLPDVSASETPFVFAGESSNDSNESSWWSKHWGKVAIGVGILLILGLFLIALIPGMNGYTAPAKSVVYRSVPRINNNFPRGETVLTADANVVSGTERTSYPLIGRVEHFGANRNVGSGLSAKLGPSSISGPRLTQETNFSSADSSASRVTTGPPIPHFATDPAAPDWVKFQNYASPAAKASVAYPSFMTPKF